MKNSLAVAGFAALVIGIDTTIVAIVAGLVVASGFSLGTGLTAGVLALVLIIGVITLIVRRTSTPKPEPSGY